MGASSSEPAGMEWEPSTASLRYQFWSAQQEALDEFMSGEHDITAFLGGYGSGKTTTGARLLNTLATTYPGSKHAAIAIDFKKGSQTTFEELFRNLPGERTHILTSNYNGPENSSIVEDYNRNDHRLTFVNDSVIRLGTADNPDDVIGDEYMSVWLDEPSKYHPNAKLYDMALETIPTRLRAHDPQLGQFWSLTGNGYNAAYEILRERRNADGDDINHDIHITYASVLENPFLDEDVRARFRRQYSGTAKEEQALYGGFATAEGLVYEVERGRQIVPLEAFGERLPPLDSDYAVYGYDAGWQDPRVVLDIRTTIGDNSLVVYDEFYKSQVHVDEAIDWLGEPGERPEGVIVTEHEPADRDDLESAGWSTVNAEKDIERGIAEVSSRFNPVDDETGERQPPRLYVAERCENTVKELFTYKQDQVGGADAKDHAMDSLRYAIMGVERGDDAGMGLASVSTR